MKRALAAPMCILGISCHKGGPASEPDAGATVALNDGAARGDAGDVARRCNDVGSSKLVGFTNGDDLEFGEAVGGPSGVFVGLLRSSRGEARAAVARVERQGLPSVVDLGATVGDVPPPQPFVRGGEVFAVGYVRLASSDAGIPFRRPSQRSLTLFRLGEVAEPLSSLTQMSEESPSFDVIPTTLGAPSGALLAWDEDAPDAHRGLIRVATLSADLRTVVRSGVVSPETTDAERPQLATRDTGGYWLAWIARKVEPLRDAGPELEGPSEDRAYRWVELLALDADGSPVASVRRLTAATGHVSGFSMATHGSRLDLYVPEEDERTDGSGGEILHIAITGDGIAHVAPTVTSGAAHGATPAVVWRMPRTESGDSQGYLAYADVTDRSWLALLDGTGAPRGTATLEPSLDDARLLAADVGGGLLVGASRPDSADNVFRWLSCSDLTFDNAPAPFP